MGREKKEGKEREKEQGKKRRKHSRRDEDSSDSDDDDSSGSSESESETESSSTSEEERERRRRRKEKKKRRRSSEGSSKQRSKVKKDRKKHTVHSKARKKPKTVEVILSMDDYFRKSVEFRTWLSEERNTFFSDLSSEESRLLFKKFVGKWNEGLLPKKYYKGLQSSALEHGKQTGHVWKFSKSLSQDQLAGVKESVSSWTAGDTGEGGAPAIGPRPPPSPTTSGVMKGPMIGPMIGPNPGPSVALAMHSDPHLREEQWKEVRERERRGRKEMRKQHELVMDELLPKATGKEARFEKKKVRAEKRRDREISPDVAESTLMGPRTNIHQKIQNRQIQRHHRAQAAADKVAVIQAKEKSKMQALLEVARANKKEGSLW